MSEERTHAGKCLKCGNDIWTDDGCTELLLCDDCENDLAGREQRTTETLRWLATTPQPDLMNFADD